MVLKCYLFWLGQRSVFLSRMARDNEKKKKKRRLKKEAEEVKNWEEEKLGNWKRRDFVAGKGVECTKEYETLVGVCQGL